MTHAGSLTTQERGTGMGVAAGELATLPMFDFSLSTDARDGCTSKVFHSLVLGIFSSLSMLRVLRPTSTLVLKNALGSRKVASMILNRYMPKLSLGYEF